MILDEELARVFREKIVKAIFGDDWRPDRPLENIGSHLNNLMTGHAYKDIGEYRQAAGRITGLREALDLFNQAAQEASAS